jgi:replicative DNA helicase
VEITRKTVDASIERKIITYCITNTDFLRSMSKSCKIEHLSASFSKEVYKWCLEYFNQYNKAPASAIKDMYLVHKAFVDDDTADLIGAFLHSLNDMEDTHIDNYEYTLEMCMNHVRMRNLELFKDKISAAVQERDYINGENLIASYSKIEVHQNNSVDIFNCDNEIINAFSMEEEKLFSLPGALGAMIGPLKRADFFGFLANQKVGKSHLLLHSGMQALKKGLKVLFVTLEMPVPQMLRRVYSGLMASPKEDCYLKLPYFYKDTEDFDEKWKIGYNDEFRQAFIPDEENLSEFRKSFKMYYPHGGFRVASFPSKAVTIKELRAYVDNLSYYEGFDADVIVIDYLDLMKIQGNEYRIGLGNLWAETRGWALEQGKCIITASQGNRSGLSASVVDAVHIAEDISKINHVTGAVSINATKIEKDKGLYRFAQVVEREGRTYSDQVLGLSCLDIGLPLLDSRWLSECEYTLKAIKEEEHE